MVYHMHGEKHYAICSDGGKANNKCQKNSRKEEKNAVGAIKNLLFYILCIGIVLSAVSFSFDQNPHKSFFGFRIYSVLTDSMTRRSGNPPGGFDQGDLLLVKIAPPEKIRIGDVITFVPGNDTTAYLTHRVVDIRQGAQGVLLTTRGDNNNANDPAITGDRLIGKTVMRIPKLGTVLQLVQQYAALFALAVLLSGIFLARRGRGGKQPRYRMTTSKKVIKSGRGP